MCTLCAAMLATWCRLLGSWGGHGLGEYARRQRADEHGAGVRWDGPGVGFPHKKLPLQHLIHSSLSLVPSVQLVSFRYLRACGSALPLC